MTCAERGFLLLTSRLGNPERQVLTPAQLRKLTDAVANAEHLQEDRELREEDILALGYRRDMAQRIFGLLQEEALLERYLEQGKRLGCHPITRASAGYPAILRQRLKGESPGCLWAKGDCSLLKTPAVSLVGSRQLQEANRRFAEETGRQAALQGLTLVSGNARGADRTAQDACLEAGGRVISVVADELSCQSERERVLYLSEEDYGEPFSARRALQRNRCIHALGRMVFVAQSDLKKGGTWNGTVKNLRNNWSPVVCFRDGRESTAQLEGMGAYLVNIEDLGDLLSPGIPEQLSIGL